MVVGRILYEMKKPAMILPRARCLIGLINNGSFSLIIIEEGNWGLVLKAK